MISAHIKRNSFIFSLVIHLVIFVFLFINFSFFPPDARPDSDNQQPIINAVSVNQSQFENQIKKIKTQETNTEKQPEEKLAAVPEVNEREQQRQVDIQQEQLEAKQEAEKKQAIAAKQAAEKKQQQELAEKKAIEEKQQQELLAEKQAEKKRQQALAEKQAAEKKRQQALAEKQAAEKKRQQALAEKQAAEKKRQQALAEKQAAEKKRQQALAKKQAEQLAAAKRKQAAENDLQEQLLAEQQAQQKMAQQREIDRYKALVVQAISQRWIIPDNVNKSISTEFLIRLAPDGSVLAVNLVRSSGNAQLDSSALNAVYKASPLPVPKDPALFNQFRQFNLTVRPEQALAEVF